MRTPIPILFTIPNFITAGSGQVLVNIIAGLDKTLFAPVVCVEKGGGRLFQTLQQMNIPLLEHPFTVSAQPHYGLLYRVWKAADYRFGCTLKQQFPNTDSNPFLLPRLHPDESMKKSGMTFLRGDFETY